MNTLKEKSEIELMKEAGQILRRLLMKLEAFAEPDITTQEIDDYASKLIAKEQVTPAFKGYKGFPASICISVNEEVVHGIPSQKRIKSGDIVSLDLGIEYKGYFVDSAITLPIGKVGPRFKKLIRVTQESLCKGIKQARVGKRLGDISYSIQRHVESNGFSIVRQFVGHGIGLSLQEEPEVPNFGQPHKGITLKAGMVLAIEPMVNLGGWEVEVIDNCWTAVTKDRLPSAHFEHTVAITENGPQVLT